MLKDLIEDFVLNLVDNRDVVSVLEMNAGNKSIIEIKVSAQDLAKVIGKEGRTFRALRTLARVVDPAVTRDIVVDVVG